MVWRPLRRGELDHERVWLCVSLAAGGIGLVWFSLDLPRPVCPLHQWTGWPCPTCGATRSAQHLLAGRFAEAFRLNPAIFGGMIAVVLYDAYAGLVLLLRWPRLRFDDPAASTARMLRFAVIVVVALNWLWLISNGR